MCFIYFFCVTSLLTTRITNKSSPEKTGNIVKRFNYIWKHKRLCTKVTTAHIAIPMTFFSIVSVLPTNSLMMNVSIPILIPCGRAPPPRTGTPTVITPRSFPFTSFGPLSTSTQNLLPTCCS